jgi:cold shock CspA family protein
LLFSVLFEEFLQMAEGTIKKLIAEKGFGFIQGEKDTEGRGPKGPRADAVTPV